LFKANDTEVELPFYDKPTGTLFWPLLHRLTTSIQTDGET